VVSGDSSSITERPSGNSIGSAAADANSQRHSVAPAPSKVTGPSPNQASSSVTVVPSTRTEPFHTEIVRTPAGSASEPSPGPISSR